MFARVVKDAVAVKVDPGIDPAINLLAVDGHAGAGCRPLRQHRRQDHAVLVVGCTHGIQVVAICQRRRLAVRLQVQVGPQAKDGVRDQGVPRSVAGQERAVTVRRVAQIPRLLLDLYQVILDFTIAGQSCGR